jgi:hypothetical protein
MAFVAMCRQEWLHRVLKTGKIGHCSCRSSSYLGAGAGQKDASSNCGNNTDTVKWTLKKASLSVSRQAGGSGAGHKNLVKSETKWVVGWLTNELLALFLIKENSPAIN